MTLRHTARWAAIAVAAMIATGPVGPVGSAGAAETVSVTVASTGGHGFYSKPGFLPFDPLFYAASPSTRASADGLPSAHALASFLDPAGHLSRGVNGNLNIVGAPALPVDPSYPYFAEARYPTDPEAEVSLPAPPEGGPGTTTPGKATASASPDGVARADAEAGAFTVTLSEEQSISALGVEGHSIADAKNAVGETMALMTDVNLGGVLKARSIRVLARVERKGDELVGAGSVLVSGATINDVPVEINDEGLVVQGQPNQPPDGSAILDELAAQGVTIVLPNVEVKSTPTSVGVTVSAPAVHINQAMEQPFHERNIIVFQAGYASAALSGGVDPVSEPAPAEEEPAEEDQATAVTTTTAGAAPLVEAPSAAADPLTASPLDFGGPVSAPSFGPAAPSFAPLPDEEVAAAGFGTTTSPTANVGAESTAQAIGSIRPEKVRDSMLLLLAGVWLSSMVALVAAAAWQRGAAA